MSTKYAGNSAILYLLTKIKELLAGKVDTVSGKGLSTNDYTNTEKTKLSNIAAGSQVNVLESVSVNGTAQTITSKGVNITVPTNTNQLTNGSGYQTAANVESAITAKGYQTAAQVASAVSAAGHLKRIKVTTLPTASIDANAIYMVPKTGSTGDKYNEYMYIDSAWELMGSSETDLSGYLKSSDMVEITTAEIDAMLA